MLRSFWEEHWFCAVMEKTFRGEVWNWNQENCRNVDDLESFSSVWQLKSNNNDKNNNSKKKNNNNDNNNDNNNYNINNNNNNNNSISYETCALFPAFSCSLLPSPSPSLICTPSRDVTKERSRPPETLSCASERPRGLSLTQKGRGLALPYKKRRPLREKGEKPGVRRNYRIQIRRHRGGRKKCGSHPSKWRKRKASRWNLC